uniref:Methyltransferase n=1 Tax=Lactuca sativa TaxID=4236 RepID=A0A9R1VVU3_LACSA|nr:hypothetical protein LSAT_V11C400214320 [Lactuca sativa]
MAIGKPRANKRSSGISCSSAVTMAVLVTVCVLGVWMLTSSSAVYPSTTTQINNLRDDTLSDIKRRFVKFHRKIPDDASKDKLLDHTTNASVSEDNHSDFLMDVMKNEDESKSHNDLENIQEKGKDYKLQVDESSGEVRFSNIEVEPKQESMGNDVDDDAESLNDSDAGKQEAEQLQEEAIEKQEMEISTTVVKDSLNGMEGEASAEEEQKQITQKIKENTMTRGDQDTGNEYDQQSDMGNQDDKQTEPGGEDDTQELEDNKEQESVNEGKEKSMQNQEEKEEQEEDKEGESQQGVTTDDQVQEDDDEPIKSHSIASETRAQAENREELDVRQKMEQAKIQTNTTELAEVKERSSQIPHESETQVDQQEDQKERQEEDTNGTSETSKVADNIDMYGYQWKLCNVKAGTNYIPCLDNEIAIRNFHHWQHNEHHERHCPKETPDCLVPLPRDYKTPIPWPQSRDKVPILLFIKRFFLNWCW